MKFSRRAVTTLPPIISKSLWVKVRSQFLHEITQKTPQYNIPNGLIINADQTLSIFVATDNITMLAQDEKHDSYIPRKQKDFSQMSIFCKILFGFQWKTLE